MRLLHLDLLVLLGFSVSHVYFNRGEISTSVPLVYPVLAYLLARMLTIGFAAPRDALPLPPRLPVPVRYLALALVFLVGFRVGLNITNSNVIDVGYSGVIGADRITHGVDLYGSFPQGNLSGDTYGPVNYFAYVPFELVFPWSGRWDDLPAAHAAAIFFDLATIVALIFVGRRLIPGEAATGWDSCWRTRGRPIRTRCSCSNSNANDSLVALLVVLAFLALRSAPRPRRAAGAWPPRPSSPRSALVPLFAGYDRRRPRSALVFARDLLRCRGAAAGWRSCRTAASRELWDRTIGFQLGRDSPFSIWGQEEWLAPLHTAVKAAAAALALVVGLYPRRKSPLQVAALGAAVLIALQLGLSHWFYLYIVWWFPLALIALLARGTRICSIELAAPLPSDVTRHAITHGSCSAVSKRTGIWVTKRSMACSFFTPMTLSRAPVIPTSEMYAVPLGSTRPSAVGTCVWVPNIASTRPSRCQPIATFSLVVSAWKSTTIRSARPSRSESSLSTTWNGDRGACRNTVPLRLIDRPAHAVLLDHRVPATGIAVEVVRRPHDAVAGIEERIDVAVTVDVIAGGDHVRARVQQLAAPCVP